MNKLLSKRALGFVIDYLIWYLLMVFMILIYFFLVEKYTPFSENLSGYVELFDGILKRPSFLALYLFALVFYELLIPLCFGGQSVSKMLLGTEIEPFTVHTILLRGTLKLFIINPCGVVAYLLALFVPLSASILSDILLVVLGLNILLLFKTGKTGYDKLSGTQIEKKVEAANEVCYSELV